MSRVGRSPITIPEGVEVQIKKHMVTVSKDGKTLQSDIHPDFEVKIDEKEHLLTVNRPSDSKPHRSMHGLFRALINNMIVGVTTGFEKKLTIVGVGYRAELKGRNVLLNVGYSHPILFKPPENIEISVATPTSIAVRGYDKQLVGQIAAKIRSLRPPEPYKGKGIKYDDEHIRRKAGKAAA